jgi:hypothetical protein
MEKKQLIRLKEILAVLNLPAKWDQKPGICVLIPIQESLHDLGPIVWDGRAIMSAVSDSNHPSLLDVV